MQVLFRDEHYVAIDKPTGLIVHRRPGERDQPAALQLVRDLVGQHVYPVHRLDRSASGVLIFGMSSDAAGRLARCFADRTVDKRYVAVVRGFIDPRGTIDYPLARDRGEPTKAAVTDFARLATTQIDAAVPPHPTARYSLVALRPRTGRTHQLRRHMAHLRHPIVGDVRHGDGRHNRVFRDRFDCHRLLLFATRLTFEHPFALAPVRIDAPPSDAACLSSLGWPSAPSTDALDP